MKTYVLTLSCSAENEDALNAALKAGLRQAGVGVVSIFTKEVKGAEGEMIRDAIYQAVCQ